MKLMAKGVGMKFIIGYAVLAHLQEDEIVICHPLMALGME